MSRRGAVQRKVPCLFVTEVKEEPSAKRERQVTGQRGPRKALGSMGRGRESAATEVSPKWTRPGCRGALGVRGRNVRGR